MTHQPSARVAKLPQFRGIPIPFFVTYREDGSPDFKAVSEKNRERCAKERLCWICGEALGYYMVFLGGPRSAESRWYVDGPMHPECADDAMALCPFMIGRTDYAKSASLFRRAAAGLRIKKFQLVDPKPPEDIVMYTTRDFTTVYIKAAGSWVFQAAKPTQLARRSRGAHQ